MAPGWWTRLVTGAMVGLLAAAIGCAASDSASRDNAGVKQTGETSTAQGPWDPSAWRAPSLDGLPDDSVGRAVRRGRALLVATRDSLPRFVGANLNCTSCHLDEGRRATASPFGGAFARYPRYLERTGAVVSIEERVN